MSWIGITVACGFFFVVGLIIGSDWLKHLDLSYVWYWIIPKPKKEFYHDQDVAVVSGFYKGKQGKVKRSYKRKHFYGIKTDNGYSIEVHYKDLKEDKIKGSKLGKSLLGQS